MQEAGELAMRWICPLLFLVCGATQAMDDCSIRMPLSSVVPELSRGCPEEKAAMEKASHECIPIKSKSPTDAYSKIYISEPGHYCLTEDLHARVEFADHMAEGAMIDIRTSDVVLDLQGHTLGRGRIFKNPGGAGIVISDQFQLWKWLSYSNNIAIRNGVLRDFETGIVAGSANTATDTPTFNPITNTYHFPANNITLENITFKNNKQNFNISAPGRETK